MKAIQEAPEPKKVTELKSNFGLLTYYARFVPNIATMLSLLYRLLHSGVSWAWAQEVRTSFTK